MLQHENVTFLIKLLSVWCAARFVICRIGSKVRLVAEIENRKIKVDDQ